MNGLSMIIDKAISMGRHLWLDATDARRILPPEMLQRLAREVASSESRHAGQIRIYVEASLPVSYLLRLGPNTSLRQLARQRAVMQFSKLRVWDTERNSGVLIYLLLAEHAIEIVADRGVSQHVTDTQWQAMVARMGSTFAQRRFEEGLTEALHAVSALLIRHFPTDVALSSQGHPNELPDEPFIG